MTRFEAGLELTQRESVFLLQMRNGENRIDAAFLESFHRALDEVEASEGDLALVTTGEGRFYSNGLDLSGMAGLGREAAIGVLEGLDRLFARLLCFPTVTVAAINGHAFAAGGMLALAQDFRVMREDRGYFCLPEIDLATGQPLTDGMSALLKARLSSQTLHAALITGARYGGEEAARRGIVEEARPEAEVVSRAVELAGSLAGKHRATLVALKRGLFAEALEILEGKSSAAGDRPG